MSATHDCTPRTDRAQPERELRSLLETRRGRQQVLDRLYDVFPDGVPLPPDDGIVAILLRHEDDAPMR